MILFHLNKKRLNENSFTESDYVVLSYEQLLKVNGAGSGSGGGSSGGPSGSSSGSASSSSTSSPSSSSSSGKGSSKSSPSSSDSGSSSGTTSNAPSTTSGNLTSQGYPSSTDPNPGIPPTSTNEIKAEEKTSAPTHQTPYDPSNYHCDIIAYNEAIDHGHENPGNWDGNASSVQEIYAENYAGQGTNTPQSNTSGYVFYDLNNDGIQDHVEYFEAGSGSDYTVYQTDGITEPPVERTYDSNVDSNGSASNGTAIFVPL